MIGGLEMAPTRASRMGSEPPGQQKDSEFFNSSKQSDSVSCQSTYAPCTPAQANGMKALLKHAGNIQSSSSRKISQRSKSNSHARWRINSNTHYPSTYGQNDPSGYSASLAGNSNHGTIGQLNGHAFKHRTTRAGCTACAFLKDVEDTNTQKLISPDYALSSKPLIEAMNAEGCWWDVEILQSRKEKHLVHYVHFDSDEDGEVFSCQLRLRSRKATPWDCFHHLHPGVDITVFSDHPQAFERMGDMRPFAAWYDARILSVYKKVHNPDCVCKFVVQFYSSRLEDQNGDGNRTLLTCDKKMVGIKKIGILQKPLKSSFGDILAKLPSLKGALPKQRWSSDAWSLKSQYTADEDESDVHIIEVGDVSSKGEASAGNGSRQSMPECRGSSQQPKPSCQSLELDFASYLETILEIDAKINKETGSSKVGISRFGFKSNGASARGTLKGPIDQNAAFSKSVSPSAKCKVVSDKIEMGSIKEGHINMKDGSLEENDLTSSKLDMWVSRQDGKEDGLTSRLHDGMDPDVEMIKEMRASGKRKMMSDINREDNKDKIRKSSVRLEKAKPLRRKKEGNANAELEEWCNALFNGDLLQVRDDWRRKESKSEFPSKMDQTNGHFLWTSSLEDGLLDPPNAGAEADSKFGEIWQEMQIALYQPTELSTKNNACLQADRETALQLTENLPDQAGCNNHHSLVFDEEAGLICEHCGLIELEIENMVPRLDLGTSEVRYRKNLSISDEENCSELSDSLINKLTESGHHHKPLSRILPHLKVQMHKHQKEGFKFLWKNIVGDKIGDTTATMQNETGGCILSHAPGTGKSLLIISFLQSFLGINPNCKPLIVAPKIMLRPWQREFLKWNVDIPVYILNTEREYRKSMALEEDEFGIVTLKNGACLQGKELGRIVTLAQWLREDSVLLVSYSLFSTLIEHGSSDDASKVSKKISEMLLETPDLLILDEGHFPRNKDTKIRSALMKVRTKLRILLSGTVFQNNFEELFNTLYLVRPQFVELFSGCINEQNDELLEETVKILDPALLSCRSSQRSNRRRGSSRLPKQNSLDYQIHEPKKLLSENEETKDKGPIEVIEIDDSPLEVPCIKRPVSRRRMWRSSKLPRSSCKLEEEKLKMEILNAGSTVEAKARRLFMKKIGSKFDQSQRDKSLHDGLQILRKLTDPFVHYYAGEVLQSLPGLHDFSVMLRPTPSQQELLEKVVKKWDAKRGLELEMAVSSVCIHPCLLADLNYEENQTAEFLEAELLRGDPEAGVKTMFVIELLRICQCTSEKVLIFSEILSPFTLLEQLTEETLGWVKGKETLRLDGKLTLDERQTIIDRINQPTDSARVLFASIKACGEGITLIGASRVVFLHMAWNPSVMKQAVSRAFRLGQKRPVYVYRLVASGTMEEDKYKRTAWKDWLSRSIFVSQSCNEETSHTTNKDLPERLPEPQDGVNLLYDACHDKVLEKLLERETLSFQKIIHCSLFTEK